MTYTIELRPRMASNGETALRGDREIWAWNGDHGSLYEYYGYAQMEGGFARRKWVIHNARGGQLPEIMSNGKMSSYSSVEVRAPHRHERDDRTFEQRIVDLVQPLIGVRLESKAIMDARAAAANEAFAKSQAESRAENQRTRDAFLSLWARGDLTNAERKGLSTAYKDLFHAAIEFVAHTAEVQS